MDDGDRLYRIMGHAFPNLLLRHNDEPPYAWTHQRWADATREWPDRRELDNAMLAWRKVSERYHGERFRTRHRLRPWLMKCRRGVNTALLRYRRARNLCYDEYRVNVIQVPYRQRQEEGWLASVLAPSIWTLEPALFTAIYDVTPNQYGGLRAFARDVDQHYRVWAELNGLDQGE